MPNEITKTIEKPSVYAPEMCVAEYLMEQFPEYTTQLKSLMDYYQNPCWKFCENEARFQLNEMEIPDNIEGYSRMVYSIARSLFNSKKFLDGEISHEIASEVLDEKFNIIV